MILSGGDGSTISTYSATEDNFKLMMTSMYEATKVVEDSDWYQQNKANLKWDEEYSLCLTFP